MSCLRRLGSRACSARSRDRGHASWGHVIMVMLGSQYKVTLSRACLGHVIMDICFGQITVEIGKTVFFKRNIGALQARDPKRRKQDMAARS
eukprot:2751130-Rhodomonas_salina.1